MFCNHKCKIVETYKFENELGKFSATISSFTARDLAKRGVVTISQCEKCGKVYHLKTVFE